jgi:division protein CdvB (Snf7/Vps24/ESCRT-III family)
MKSWRNYSLISNSWNKGTSESLSQKVMGRVRPDEPLKNKIEFAQRKLQSQITKLEGINIKLQSKHDVIFEKIVNAQKSNNNAYAKAYAIELTQLRKMKNMVSGAKLSMEQVQLRLGTVSELGDVVVTLSPAMSLIKGLSSSLSGIMPEANASMQDLSQILGDVLTGSSVNDTGMMNAGISENPETLAILEEAHSVIEGQTKTIIPEVPDNLKHDIVQRRRSDVLI